MNTQGSEHIRSTARLGDSTRIRSRLSAPLVAITVASFAAGVVSGGIHYLQRSPHREMHVDGTAAWGPHLVLLVLAVIAFGVVRRRTHSDARFLLAPVSAAASKRLVHTLSAVFRHPTALLRLLLALVPVALLVYSPWRIGMQILAGLDPNFTVNAWGGPSYLGAMACHYLDAVLLMAAAAGLLNLLLLRRNIGSSDDAGMP
ncbi:hypothetical protein AB0H76_34275 [Nocardia sp. NPDC050712]|uniref:hypothetical protein n=1 Tax=Nocardia sp. NPDC050712 TaxID=3155518 RepID=UPI0033DAA9A8